MFDEEEELDLIESIHDLIYDYIDRCPTCLSEPDFHETLIEALKEMLELQMEEFLNKHKLIHFFFFYDSSLNHPEYEKNKKELEEYEDWMERMDEIVVMAVEMFYQSFMPRRSYPDTMILYPMTEERKERIRLRIDYLRNKPQPKQRSDEWYEVRYNLITASNAYKVFESQTMRNQLICEKCKPIVQEKEDIKTVHLYPTVNINTTFHWGQKYEPLSVMFYERLYKTKVGEFGCIQHDTYLFLGASPDGINIDPSSPRYGRLLEIKNIVNREIDGIPKKEYWIQMQLQMETCGLDECDFLEMRFTEYKEGEGEDDVSAEKKFMMDGETFDKTEMDEYKGVIMYFCKEDGNPHYEYMPLEIQTYKDYIQWEKKTMERMDQEKKTWIRNLYWKLEEYSCVLVERNRLWFEKNIGEMESIWGIIVRERVTGCEHRAATKRTNQNKSRSESLLETPLQNKCFLQYDKETGNVTIQKGM